MLCKLALHNVKRAIKKLENMELLAVEHDYNVMISETRAPPFLELHKNCSISIKGSEDNEVDSVSLQSAHEEFITKIESLNQLLG